ncbi:MAG TPA: tetratricopeptide repeat protein [Candidatus Cybelea sp.]|nr:tetratricopeptide repeat protein [Candidatus Cybelea sp.]
MTPVSLNDLSDSFHLLSKNPEKFLEMTQQHLQGNPASERGYYYRHYAWHGLGRLDLALADLNACLDLRPYWGTYQARGNIYRQLGSYDSALADFQKAERLDPEAWADSYGPLFRAECHARLGDLNAALSDCACLSDSHWTPGVFGAPAGNKDEVAAELARLAAEARPAGKS